MKNLDYLNVGCGHKYHPDWVNLDMVSYSKDVKAVNLIKGIPFPESSFSVVYHSQVLEHIPKPAAPFFLSECYRVLKTGGTLRIVLPDLENIVREYLRLLDQNVENPTPESEANYDWIMLELFDQTVRNNKGGLMAEYLQQPKLVNESYVLDRIGFVGKNIRNAYLSHQSASDNIKKALSSVNNFRIAAKYVLDALISRLAPSKYAVGHFRLGGEIHMWMYDRYSLKRLLESLGFKNVTVQSPTSSLIVDWERWELDVKDGQTYDPTSLFIEAQK